MLTEDEYRRIFKGEILSDLSGQPQKEPLLLVVGGQPGAGKSAAERRLALSLGRTGMTSVDLDDFRQHSPAHRATTVADDITAAERTHADARRFTDLAQDHAIAQRWDVVYSTTLSSGQAAEDTITKFRAAGYRVEVAAVATPEAQSRLGVIQRYTDQRDRTGSGRYVPPNVQTHAYARMPGGTPPRPAVPSPSTRGQQ